MHLSDTEKQILYHLSLDARISLAALAKKIGKTKQAVSYHLSQLDREKIILGYFAVTNIYAIGKTHYRVFLRLQKMTGQDEENFINFLGKHPQIIWTAKFSGDLDIAFLVWADTVQEFEGVLDEINYLYGKFIYKKEFSIATKIEYLKYKFFNQTPNNESRVLGGQKVKVYPLDGLDQKILAHLNKRGRDPFSIIAKKLNVSPITVQKRVQKMQQNNVIIAFNYKLNHQLLKLTHRKIRILLDEYSKQSLESIEEYLRAQPSVIYLVKVIGEYDFEFEIMTGEDEEYDRLLKNLRNKFVGEIKTFSTLIHYYEPKSGQINEF
jgi:DNA-binding Lrp family transcriptional regulator